MTTRCRSNSLSANHHRRFLTGEELYRDGKLVVKWDLDNQQYNRDPAYLRDLQLYRLTLEARKRIAESQLSKREIVRRLGTSAGAAMAGIARLRSSTCGFPWKTA